MERERFLEYRREVNRRYYARHRSSEIERCRKIRKEQKEKLREQRKIRVAKNPEHYKEINRAWVAKNIEWRKAIAKNYYYRHRIKVLEKQKERMQSDFAYRIKHYIRCRLKTVLKNRGVVDSKSRTYDINIGAIATHLGKMPEDGKEYHIDHIRPLCSFDLTKPEEVKKAFAPENHQWLEATANRKKGGRYDVN